MEKKGIGGVIFFMLVAVALCGCQAGQVDNDSYSDFFESSVVQLVNFSLEFQKDKDGNIVDVTVNGRISNLLDKAVNIEITTDFFDKNNKLLGNSTIRIFGLQPKGTPGSSTNVPPPYLNYKESDVSSVDHVKIRAYEIT